jgi:hypothetical protein
MIDMGSRITASATLTIKLNRYTVIAGLVPAIRALLYVKKTWMRGSSPRMTKSTQA